MTLLPIEYAAVEAARERRAILRSLEPTKGNILETYLHVALRIAARIRASRMFLGDTGMRRKDDGTPVSAMDGRCEEEARELLASAFPDFAFMGEETAGTLASDRPTTACDPIDATWSFLAHDSTNAFALSLLDGRKTRLGIVANPATGELAYAHGNDQTRLIQLSAFGEGHFGQGLPSANPVTAGGKILVNFHASHGDCPLHDALRHAWEMRMLKHVKSPGGSPSIGLLEAAKGHYDYVQLWSETKPAAAYDLTAGTKLVENAGGLVVGKDGRRIDPLGHTGLLIASVYADHRTRILEVLSAVS